MADDHYRSQIARWQADANARNQQQAAAAREYEAGLNQWRQQYDQQERINRLQNIQTDAAVAQQERDAAIARGDLEEAELRDRDLRELSQEWRQLNPPGPPPADPKMVEYAKRREGVFQRHGDAAINAFNQAHGYATRPRNPNPDPNNLANHGMGLRPGTREYFKAMDTLMENYGSRYGVKFDPASDVTPGLREAAKISGLTVEEYQKAQQEVYKAEKFSGQKNGQR